VTPFKVWFERTPPAAYARLLDGAGVIVGSGPQLAGIEQADAIIASARVRYDGSLMDRAPSLRVISRTGLGVDNIVVDDASRRRIAICNAPQGPTTSAAEHAIALLLAVAKDLPATTRALREGRTDSFNEYAGIELDGLQLGLVGLGQIGRRVAAFGRALGMRVAAYDPFADEAPARRLGVTLLSTLELLLESSDVVSLHAPLTASTRRLLDGPRIALMRRGAVLVNTARGGLVDEAALLDALERGHLRGAGLDVFDPEPPDPGNPLLQRDDVIATPHIASATAASKDRLWRIAIEQALQVLRGERPANVLNPQIWA
jgi:D-3-phosphoglycerate dehydrogenase